MLGLLGVWFRELDRLGELAGLRLRLLPRTFCCPSSFNGFTVASLSASLGSSSLINPSLDGVMVATRRDRRTSPPKLAIAVPPAEPKVAVKMKREALLAELSKLSKDQLIERILGSESTSIWTNKAAKKARRAEKTFDWSAYPKKHVAMKVAYLGWQYHGFASQISFKTSDVSNLDADAPMSSIPTIEEHLFRAMMKAKLIESPGQASYSRCGRTDAGVSATGQVIGATIRCGNKGDSGEEISLPVAVIMNSILPPEIRVLDICPAPEGFNARFDCKYREYNYYFPRQNLDLDAMKEAAALLLGTHDFRNLSKRDPSKDVQNYVRTILESRIEPVNPMDQEGPYSMYRYVIRGTAFLYHQVRCTMAVLFLVGQGVEKSSIIPYLIDQEIHEDWRPTYQMASDIPLVLVDCGFDSISFCEEIGQDHDSAYAKNMRHFHGLWREKIAQTLTIQSLLPTESIPYMEPKNKVQVSLRK